MLTVDSFLPMYYYIYENWKVVTFYLFDKKQFDKWTKYVFI